MAPGGPDGCGARWTAQAARPEARAERMSMMRFRTSWLARLLRGRRLDRNPLRRGSDRAETVVLGVLLAAFLAAAPFAAQAAGALGHDSAARQAQAQRASPGRGGQDR
jgi:hypothetical protein